MNTFFSFTPTSIISSNWHSTLKYWRKWNGIVQKAKFFLKIFKDFTFITLLISPTVHYCFWINQTITKYSTISVYHPTSYNLNNKYPKVGTFDRCPFWKHLWKTLRKVKFIHNNTFVGFLIFRLQYRYMLPSSIWTIEKYYTTRYINS